MANLLDLLSEGPVLGDLVEDQAEARPLNFLDAPEMPAGIYDAAIQAGARLIRTVTPWGGHPERLVEAGIEVGHNEYNWKAARLAADVAAHHQDVVVAGFVALGANGYPEEIREQMGALLDGGSGSLILDLVGTGRDNALSAINCFQNLSNVPLVVILGQGGLLACDGQNESALGLIESWQIMLDSDVDIVVLRAETSMQPSVAQLLRNAPVGSDDFLGVEWEVGNGRLEVDSLRSCLDARANLVLPRLCTKAHDFANDQIKEKSTGALSEMAAAMGLMSSAKN